MSQKTNLNINPYYDDYNSEKNFYKVLFKPGFPVQARELSTLQSLLQGQVESFGSHIFKEGSVVVPGNTPSSKGSVSLYCAVIVKTVDERTRSKTSVNDLLRD